MKISVITSVYNNKETIQDAINSVLNQSYKNIEYIIVDGGSYDGTWNIIQNYEHKISKYISDKDKGIYDGLNKGIALATGDIICFLHSDDLYPNDNILQAVANEFITKDIDGIYGDLIYTPKNNTEKIVRYWKSQEFNKSLLKKGWMPAHPTLFLKRSVYEKYGGFDLDFKIAADYDFMLRILKEEVKVAYLPLVLYKMRIGGASNKNISNVIQKSYEDLKALKKNNIGGIDTLIYKNLSKIKQFFYRS